MNRREFESLVAETLDSLPEKFRRLIQNVVVVIEDFPPDEGPPTDDTDDLLMGLFDGTPRTEASVFDAQAAPSRVILYQQNIEAYARDAAREEGRAVEQIIREEVRLTVLHELGHYFGLDEDALEDV